MVSSIARNQGCISEVEKSGVFNSIPLPTNALFGTDGIRGKVGDLLNAPLALQVGFWAGVVLRNYATVPGPIVLGQDSRNSSDMLAMALSAGLTAAGLEVWYLGLCPTPCVAYLSSITNAIGGIMISASHNPPEDNGIKIFDAEGGKLSKALQGEIEAGLRGQLSADLIKTYSQSIQTPLASGLTLQGMKIVLDLAWGAAVGLAPAVFTEMGAEVICLHNEADGDRINVNCGSTHLDILQAAVVANQADMGFAFDGDADRVLAVDNTGRSVNGDYILYLWGRHLQQKQQLPDNLIVSTVMANLGFERAWEQIGGKLIRTAVGDQYVQAEMQKTGGMLGGEQSGHILCSHYAMTGDGLLTALHIAAVVKEANLSLGEMVDQSFQTYPQILRNVRVLDRERWLGWESCQPVKQAIAIAEVAMGDHGRILVRASGTEPVIRVMVEAANAELVHHWTNELVAKVEEHLT